MYDTPGIRWRGSRKQKAPLSKVWRETILAKQEHRCFYCGIEFWEFFVVRNRLLCATVHWDHVRPFSFTLANWKHGFVAACAQCNLIKGSKVFDSEEQARFYIRKRRRHKGLPNRTSGPWVIAQPLHPCAWCRQPMPNSFALESFCGWKCRFASNHPLDDETTDNPGGHSIKTPVMPFQTLFSGQNRPKNTVLPVLNEIQPPRNPHQDALNLILLLELVMK